MHTACEHFTAKPQSCFYGVFVPVLAGRGTGNFSALRKLHGLRPIWFMIYDVHELLIVSRCPIPLVASQVDYTQPTEQLS